MSGMVLNLLHLILKGGQYSGNFGHSGGAGGPGNPGGSGKGGGFSKIGINSRDEIPKKIEEYKKNKVKPESTLKGNKKVSKKNLERADYIDPSDVGVHKLSYGLKSLYNLSKNCSSGKIDCRSIVEYSGNNSFEDINGNLRKQKELLPEHKKIVDSLDKTLDDLPRLNGNLIVYRGITSDTLDRIQIGSEFQDNAYVSTTIDEQVTKSFGDIQAEIRLPKGTKGAYIAEISNYGDAEKEFLLPRGSKFKVLEKTDKKVVLELLS